MTLLAPRFALPATLLAAAGDPGEGQRESQREADGERAAFQRQMEAAWPEIVRLVERLLAWPGAGAEVEDVAQDVFLAAWKGRSGFRGEAEWRSWVYAIAVRRARNAARSKRRRERWFGRLLSGPALDSALDAATDGLAEESTLALRVSEDMRAALSGLGHADRELLVLRYLEDRSVAEIEGWLGLSRAAVDARLSRARRRLRERMDSARPAAEPSSEPSSETASGGSA